MLYQAATRVILSPWMRLDTVSRYDWRQVSYLGLGQLSIDREADRGYGNLRGATFRIAHMGAVMPDDLTAFLAAFDAALDSEELAG